VFEHRAFSCFLGSVKPEPECYRAVLAMLGAQPRDVVFLDDRPENVAGATALGIRGVRFTTPQAARAALAGYGVTVTPRG
jgi:putative hydrolase of the HAD superfamily